MTTEAWIGLASLVVTGVGVAIGFRFRPHPMLAADPHSDARRGAQEALNDLEAVLRGVIVGQPLTRDSADRVALDDAIRRLQDVWKNVPALATTVLDVLPEAQLFHAYTQGVPTDDEVRRAMDDWRKDQKPYAVYEPGQLLRRLAGGVAGQLQAAHQCQQAIENARKKLSR